MKVNDLFRSKKSLAAADLRDEKGKARAVRVTIDTVTTQEFDDKGQKVIKPIIHFVGHDKTLVCNVTNARRIIDQIGTDETDDWSGWSIVLYPTMVDGPAGNKVDAVRVVDTPGSARPPAQAAKRAVAPPEAPEEEFGGMPDDDSIPFMRMPSY